MSLIVPRGWSGNETRADEFNSPASFPGVG